MGTNLNRETRGKGMLSDRTKDLDEYRVIFHCYLLDKEFMYHCINGTSDCFVLAGRYGFCRATVRISAWYINCYQISNWSIGQFIIDL